MLRLDLTETEEVSEVSDGADFFGWGRRIVNNAAYGDITNYKRLLARQYILKLHRETIITLLLLNLMQT